MTTDPREQLSQFLSALFSCADIIEVRPIRIWNDVESGLRKSQIVDSHRSWSSPEQLVGKQGELSRLNLEADANIFMGVCPRTRIGGGKKCDVDICRCLWADLDGVTTEIARWRCEAIGVGDPSVIVDSGHGVHLYWLLDKPLLINDAEARHDVEDRLKLLYRRLGCDATCDANRLLRLPGYLNMKNARNGETPTPCRLVRCKQRLRYSIDCFERPSRKPTRKAVGTQRIGDGGVFAVRELLLRLDDEVDDRSLRDFGVVCSLLRLGVSETEIRNFVIDRSKFSTNGEPYFELTLANALKATGQQYKSG